MNDSRSRIWNGYWRWSAIIGVTCAMVALGIYFAIPRLHSRKGIIADWERRGMNVIALGYAPRWLKQASPYLADWYEQHFPELDYLSDGDGTFSNNDLSNLQYFREIGSVFINGSQINNEGIAALRGVDIKSLHLWDTSISDTGISQLSGIINLESLHIGGSQITLSAFSELPEMTKLNELSLSRIPFKDNGQLDLTGVQQITRLTLRENGLTDETIKGLSVLTSLKELEIKEPKLTNAGLSVVAALPSLEILRLINTQITDAGLELFRTAKSLKEFRVEGTKVTLKGVEALRRSRPDCQINPSKFELPRGCLIIPGYKLTE